MKRVGLIVAGGTGERLGLAGGKQMLEIGGRPVLSHAVAAFERCTSVDEIVVVAHPDRVDEYRVQAVDVIGARKVVAVVAGGETRQDSVAAGLGVLPSGTDLVLVHDGARPAIAPALIDAAVRLLEGDDELDGVVIGHPVYDTLKLVDADARVIGTVDRTAFWVAQTPQVFRLPALLMAYDRAACLGESATDDASLVERAGGCVRMLEGPRTNMKVTVPEDIELLAAVLDDTEGEVSHG